jgi:hypothetical protein
MKNHKLDNNKANSIIEKLIGLIRKFVIWLTWG